MSVICGIIGIGGKTLEQPLIHRLAGAMEKSGPDRLGVFSSPNALLAHRLLFTTPESLTEFQPHSFERSALTIVADARLDNREEIAAALGLPLSVSVSDSELILSAFEAWREKCLNRLLGDFAFAVWDRDARELFIARDHLGLRALYYTEVDGEFLFASEIKALLAHPSVTRGLNRDRMRSTVEQTDPHAEATFHQGILRLPPATWLRVNSQGAQSRRTYWALDRARELAPATDEEYAEQFRALFTEAVRCRLRSAFPIGTHLSGGLDSTAVTCLAAKILREEGRGDSLKAFSMVFDWMPSCDEREFVDTVVRETGIDTSLVKIDRVGPMYHIDEYFDFEDEGSLPPNQFLNEQLCAAVRNSGARVCLDGFDGDTTVGHGYERFTELARGQSWTSFAHEAEAVFGQDSRITKEHLFWVYGAPEVGARARRGEWKRFASDCCAIRRQFNVPLGRVVRDHVVKPGLSVRTRQCLRMLRGDFTALSSRDPGAELFSSAFRQDLGCADQPSAVMTAPTTREEQCNTLGSGLFSFALEHTSRLYARYGMEVRHPFLDKRLVEFCVALPSSQKLKAGFSRAIMRLALKGLMPEKICSRVTKGNYSQAEITGAIHFDRPRILQALDAFDRVENCAVNPVSLRRCYESMLNASRIQQLDFRRFWLAFTTAYWLHRDALPRESICQTTRN